jgi:hypothetical protein
MTKQKDTVNREQEISLLFANASTELDSVNEQAHKQKKQIIRDLAGHLEGMIPTESICIEIVTQLCGKVSERFIRECLDDKYKKQHRMQNARKQKKTEEHKDKENLAASAPLNQEEETENKDIVIMQKVDGSSELEERELQKNIKLSPIGDNANAGVGWDGTKLASWQQGSRNQSSPGLKECSGCKELYIENCELKEALEKSSKLITADKAAYAAADSINEIHNVLEFEFHLRKQEIIDYLGQPYLSLKDGDLKIWFSGKIDTKNRHVISAKIGRSQQEVDPNTTRNIQNE